MDEHEIETFRDQLILMLSNDSSSYTGKKAQYDRPGIDPKILKLMELSPIIRSGWNIIIIFLSHNEKVS